MSNPLLNLPIRADILNLSSYAVAKADGKIKLDAMENPYHLTDQEKQQLGLYLAQIDLNRYPVPDYGKLKALLRQTYDLSYEFGLVLGNGSDELISLLCQLVAAQSLRSEQAAVVLAPEPSFVMYKMSAVIAKCDYVGVALQDDFSLDMHSLIAAIDQYAPSLIFLAYPNNPTGNLFDEDQLIEVINAAPNSIVVIDEAYQPFASRSFVIQIANYTNVVLLRTVSKLGLAGLRLGYAVGNSWLMEQLDKIRPPYNINVLSEQACIWALENYEVFERQTHDIVAERSKAMTFLKTLPNIQVFGSEANFILIRCLGGQEVATALYQHLWDHDILVKRFPTSILADCLRITIGTTDEMAQCLQTIANFLG